jgi:hypothetical protein
MVRMDSAAGVILAAPFLRQTGGDLGVLARVGLAMSATARTRGACDKEAAASDQVGGAPAG